MGVKDSTFVHDYWSSDRVPKSIQSVVRVPIEFPKVHSGIAFRPLHLLLVIQSEKSQINRKETTNE